jgi:hypothetical protein
MTPRRLVSLRVKAPLWTSRLGGALMPWACARTSFLPPLPRDCTTWCA